jgi:hypothetical protein
MQPEPAFGAFHDQRGLADVARLLRADNTPQAAATATAASPTAQRGAKRPRPEGAPRTHPAADPPAQPPAAAQPPPPPRAGCATAPTPPAAAAAVPAAAASAPVVWGVPPPASGRSFADLYAARYVAAFGQELGSLEGGQASADLLLSALRAGVDVFDGTYRQLVTEEEAEQGEGRLRAP